MDAVWDIDLESDELKVLSGYLSANPYTLKLYLYVMIFYSFR